MFSYFELSWFGFFVILIFLLGKLVCPLRIVGYTFIFSFILRLFDFIFCTSIDPLSLLNLEEVRLYLQLLMFDGLLLLTAIESYELPLSSALMSCFAACFGSPSYTNFWDPAEATIAEPEAVALFVLILIWFLIEPTVLDLSWCSYSNSYCYLINS